MFIDYTSLFLFLSLGLGLFELLAYKVNMSTSILRKLCHVGMVLLICGLSTTYDYRYFAILGFIFTLLMIILRYIFPLKALSDRAEKSLGEIFFPLGVGVTALIAENEKQFIVCILIMGLSDTVAYILGTYFSSTKIIFDKTVIGSVGFLLCTLLILLPIAPLQSAILIAFILALCELFSPYGSDNLTIPIVAASFLSVYL